MRNITNLSAFVVIIGLITAGGVVAQHEAGLIVYRDTDGQLTPTSEDVARQMVQIASRQGHITLWLTLNYAFDLYLDEQADQEAIAAQNAAIREGFGEVLDPLIARQAAWYPETGPYFHGPGCSVRATEAGLRRLIRDDRILQIVAVE